MIHVTGAPRPPAPEVCVGAVVVRSGRILLVRRGRPPGAGLWSIPGGRVEGGETLAAAVRRETQEETGLAVEPRELLGWAERIGEDHHFVILDFLADTPGDIGAGWPDAVAGDDASEARWVALSDLGALALVDGLADFLERHGIGTAGTAGTVAGDLAGS